MTAPPANVLVEEERGEIDEDAGYRDAGRARRRLVLVRREPPINAVVTCLVSAGLLGGLGAIAWVSSHAKGRDSGWDAVLLIAILVGGFAAQAAGITLLERKRIAVEAGTIVVSSRIFATKTTLELAIADVWSFCCDARETRSSRGTKSTNHRVLARTMDGRDTVVLERLDRAAEATWIAAKLREHLGLPELSARDAEPRRVPPAPRPERRDA